MAPSPSSTLAVRCLLSTLLATSAAAGHATISQTSAAKPAPNTVYFRMTGTIAPGDAKKLLAMLEKNKAQPGKMNVWIHMDARGGDLEESFRIGRLLRKYNAYASHGQCVGSCIYAYMGAGTRYYTAPIAQPEMSLTPPDKTGLWALEPFVMAKVQPLIKTNPAIAKALDNVRDYVVEMTGKPDFYNSAIKIPHTTPIRMSRNNVFDMNVGSLNANGDKTKQSMPVGQKMPAW